MPQSIPILAVAIRQEDDLLSARKRARQICQGIGLSVGDTTRVVTALSEITRNVIEYGGGGTVSFAIDSHGSNNQELVLRVVDKGPGIADIAAVMSRDFQSRTGMGIGIRGSRALMDRFEITSAAGAGTTVMMSKGLPWSAPQLGAADIQRLLGQIEKTSGATPLGELQAQNLSLLQTLEELTHRNTEVERLGAVATVARETAELAQGVAERSLVVRDRFMALTTHELRTPLNAIIGYLELLDMDVAKVMTEEQQRYFGRIQKASAHMLRVTNDFLEMAQGDAGRLQVERHAGTARHVMKEAAALVTPQAAARDINIHLSETSDGIKYLGDSHRVRQVLVNLLGNAVTFTPRGKSVEVTAERVRETPEGVELPPGQWCAIRVADAGPGIPPEKVGHVFEPFVQLSPDGQPARTGSGLGLTVSRQLARLMGGDLTAESRETGAVFTLWLADGVNESVIAATIEGAREPMGARR